jgi:simple sugar transport system ATP-binding protein
VAACPCRGLDLGATGAVQQIMLDQKERGAGVLLISEDLDELLGLSDRIAVIYEGRIMGVVDPGTVSIEKIGLMMCGERNA